MVRHEGRDELKKKLLESELKDLENYQPTHIARNEKAYSK